MNAPLGHARAEDKSSGEEDEEEGPLQRGILSPHDELLMSDRRILGRKVRSNSGTVGSRPGEAGGGMYEYHGSPMASRASESRDIRGEDIFAGIAQFYPLRTHLAFASYLVLLSLFVVYIFVNPLGFDTDKGKGGCSLVCAR